VQLKNKRRIRGYKCSNKLLGDFNMKKPAHAEYHKAPVIMKNPAHTEHHKAPDRSEALKFL
jgi:hypothetical protein